MVGERARLVQRVVTELPFASREILVLREFEGMSYAEIAEVLGCPIGTVKSRLVRAREDLRKRLEPLLEA